MTREEAIRRIKAWNLDSDDKEVLAVVIPEFHESEDERIRKKLIEIIGYFRSRGIDQQLCEKFLAYLEKQKDLNNMIVVSPEVWDNAISDAYENGKKDEEKQKEPHYTKRNALFDKCVENCDPEVMKKVSDEVAEMLEKEKQKEQKFTHHEVDESLAEAVTHQMEDDGDVDDFVRKGLDDVVLKYAELGAKWQKEQESESCESDTNVEKVIEDVIRVYRKTQGEWIGGYDVDTLIVNLRRAFNKKEQKPAEWSEEDKDAISGAIGILLDDNNPNFVFPEHSKLSVGEIIKRLKSLPERFNLQPKQEWSEEDEKMLRTIISDGSRGVELDSKQITWLKSLRPQPKVELTLLDENIIEAAVAFVEQNNHFNYWGGIDKRTVIKALRSLKPHWKPSKDQMEALLNTLHPDDPYYPELKSLHEQLQKL